MKLIGRRINCEIISTKSFKWTGEEPSLYFKINNKEYNERFSEFIHNNLDRRFWNGNINLQWFIQFHLNNIKPNDNIIFYFDLRTHKRRQILIEYLTKNKIEFITDDNYIDSSVLIPFIYFNIKNLTK